VSSFTECSSIESIPALKQVCVLVYHRSLLVEGETGILVPYFVSILLIEQSLGSFASAGDQKSNERHISWFASPR